MRLTKKRKNVPMDTAAFKTKEIAKTDTGPLGAFHTAIGANVVTRHGLDNRLVGGGHLNHGELV